MELSGVLTFKLEAPQRAQGQCDAPHIPRLWDVGETRRGHLVSQAFGHAGVSERLVHQHQGQHLQQAVLDVLLELRDLAAQVVQHRCEGGTGPRRRTMIGTPAA